MSERRVDEKSVRPFQGPKFPPAEGLRQLTQAQVKAIDEAAASLCAYSRATGEEVHLTIVIRRGLPRGFTRYVMVMDELKP